MDFNNGGDWNNNQSNENSGDSWNNNQSGGNGWNNGGNGNNWGGWQNQTPPPIQRQPVFINGILNRPILKN